MLRTTMSPDVASSVWFTVACPPTHGQPPPQLPSTVWKAAAHYVMVTPAANFVWETLQLLLGHSKIESTVRYLGIEVDDAIEIAEKIDI